MAKNIIWNVLINLAIVFLILSGAAAYNSGNVLILGLSIALLVLMLYLKVVLMKYVRRMYAEKGATTALSKKKKTK